MAQPFLFSNPIAKVIGTLISLVLALPVCAGIGALDRFEVFAGDSAVTVAELQDCEDGVVPVLLFTREGGG